ncbi:hypothetical protein [Gandjariella thermophila]|uniref:DUF3558 domain-containing protein n=1 Tax=Gandjariella thermophila TaxID=1931992 RepID=A0A4D4J5A5_9PSEU|nr:hypothetical protein [Gandjariella thermophila]GDY30644.1 hypothetical protein GTS_22770 [Gandjariella thermophila]
MRTISVASRVLLGLIAVAVSACSTAPAPSPAKPAPTLPADSIAYDRLPVRTDRPSPFAGDCSQLAANRSVVEAMGVDPNDPANVAAFQRSSRHKLCDLKVDGGEVFVAAEEPQPGHPDPWESAWNNGPGDHFRRLILLGRYYAAYEFQQTMLGKGCQITVQTGSPAVLSLSFFDKRFDNVDVTADRQQGRAIGRETCPRAQHMAEALLSAIDPDGGSLASS